MDEEKSTGQHYLGEGLKKRRYEPGEGDIDSWMEKHFLVRRQGQHYAVVVEKKDGGLYMGSAEVGMEEEPFFADIEASRELEGDAPETSEEVRDLLKPRAKV